MSITFEMYLKSESIHHHRKQYKADERVTITRTNRYHHLSAQNRIHNMAAPRASEKTTPCRLRRGDKFAFADLFCGIGGFHQALAPMGGKCVFACDIDPSCREVYERNYGHVPEGNIRDVLNESIPAFDVLCAGFPCQPFSKAGARAGFADETRGTLFYEIIRIAKHHRPRYMLLENVPNIAKHNGGRTWTVMRDAIRDLGYDVQDDPLILSALHFGVPQCRKRVIIMCARRGASHRRALPVVPKLADAKAALRKNVAHHLDKTIEPVALDARHAASATIWGEFVDINAKNDLQIIKCPIWTDWWDRDLPGPAATGHVNKTTAGTSSAPPPAVPDAALDKDRALYARYRTWIDRNRTYWTRNRDILRDWLDRARQNVAWKGTIRNFEWQAGRVDTGTRLDQMLWTCRPSGVRVKKTDYIPTLVAMSQIPVFGPLGRKITPRELLPFQSFPSDFIYTTDRKLLKQLGNTVNVDMIKGCARFLLFGENLFPAPRIQQNNATAGSSQ